MFLKRSQLADMLAAISRRALNNPLQSPGWSRFGRPMVAAYSTPLLQLGRDAGRHLALGGQIERVWRALKTGKKEMRLRPEA
jgi:hypothetical protein